MRFDGIFGATGLPVLPRRLKIFGLALCFGTKINMKFITTRTSLVAFAILVVAATLIDFHLMISTGALKFAYNGENTDELLTVPINGPSIFVVVSRFNEPANLSWLSHLSHTIYNRGDEILGGSLHSVDVLDNVGRESFIYLKHIVDNYHSLADLNVFTQAGQTWGNYSDSTFKFDVLRLASGRVKLPPQNEGFAFLSSSAYPVEFGLHGITFRNGIPHEPLTDAVFERFPDLPLTVPSVRERIKLLITNVFLGPYIEFPRFSPTGTFVVTREAVRRRTIDYYRRLARYLND